MEDRVYNVKNRSASMVIYNIPEDGIRREFAPSETKLIKREELEKLTYQAGGRELMQNFLQIQDVTVREALNIETEPEYDMTEKQIAELILTGDMAAFLDCLDYAPTGVIDLIKVLSVNLPMTDTGKIDALREKTGFDVSQAILNSKEEEEVTEQTEMSTVSTGRRRTNVQYGEAATAPKYNVVKRDNA